MKIEFNIDYRTVWGEEIYLAGDVPELGGNLSPDVAVKMELSSDGHWRYKTDVTPAQGCFKYRYYVKRENGSIRHEWGNPHSANIGSHVAETKIFDKWSDFPDDKAVYSTAFLKCINPHHSDSSDMPLESGTLTIKVSAPYVPSDMTLGICGNCEPLGFWQIENAPELKCIDFPSWSITLPLSSIGKHLEYKFFLMRKNTREFIAWEPGNNRSFDKENLSANSAVLIGGDRVGNPLPPYRGAGTAIPVFSLRSEADFGVGDFYDLLPLIDWAQSTHQQFIQLLPINDTTMSHTWADSYPYNANSTFALHPMYLRLEAMGTLKDEMLKADLEDERTYLNNLEEVDYERANNAKEKYTRALFRQELEKLNHDKDFADFIDNNRSWLMPYAAYCTLRDRLGTSDIRKWGEYATYVPSKISEFISDNRNDIEYFCFIQYHLDKQMKHVIRYAHDHGVAIKGDIPIGISRDSVDAWLYPSLFNLNCSAGAPPDDFSVLGQNWGFPTYNWEAMNKDGFAWWKARLRKMSEYFDAYRIDHVLGFFRIWQIPLDAVHGLLGTFNPALPYSPDEMRNNYDFWINPDVQARPFIREYMLDPFFGEYAAEARSRFFETHDNGVLTLKEPFSTQRKVAEYFATEPKNEKNTLFCNALFGLIDDVLFIEDSEEKGKYHPRISAQFTYSYRSLNDYEKWCYDRLYNDFFYRRHNEFWYGKAMWKLPPLIDSTQMLCCAEDLGMIPDCVPDVMHRLQMLSLEIQRMPKDPHDMFGNPHNYPYLSVCTTSTHDMGGIRLWWEENRDKTQAFFNNMLHEPGAAPYFAEPWICDKILKQNLSAPSILCIIPLQDWLSCDAELRRENPSDEQINIPANPRHYWRYRMHITLEQLRNAEIFNQHITEMIINSGR